MICSTFHSCSLAKQYVSLTNAVLLLILNPSVVVITRKESVLSDCLRGECRLFGVTRLIFF